MRRSQRRSIRRSVIVDTPEPNGNISIVEDSVFDDSQVSLMTPIVYIESIKLYNRRFLILLREVRGLMSVDLSGFACSPEAGISPPFSRGKRLSSVRVSEQLSAQLQPRNRTR